MDLSMGEPLVLELKCNRCGLGLSRKFEWACFTPVKLAEHDDWDGALLSRIVECDGCGAIDDYALAPSALRQLTAGIVRRADGAPVHSRVFPGVSLLWDGSVGRRPAQTLERLRRLAAEHPGKAEAFRRLGNACERLGLMEEAVPSWKKALDLDPADIEAAYSLGSHFLWGSGANLATGVAYVRRGVRAISMASVLKRDVREWGEQVMRLVHHLVTNHDFPLALHAAWFESGKGDDVVAHLSSVDLHKVRDFDLLTAFALLPEVTGLDITDELPEEEPTILQALLSRRPAGAARLGLHHGFSL
ncbi:MAG: tetratricopeptide repeat protein [Deltaproteobacteria bacterium]